MKKSLEKIVKNDCADALLFIMHNYINQVSSISLKGNPRTEIIQDEIIARQIFSDYVKDITSKIKQIEKDN